jgi:hypothetical protein
MHAEEEGEKYEKEMENKTECLSRNNQQDATLY